ncbi:MAG TPA: DUF2782 domain-containing protein [Candidatus Saccharimonadia bacterium]|nr:DUF2782 domain-containing protein [Candidatus Saccharimonadia bacterium]
MLTVAIGVVGLANATEYPNRVPHGTPIDRVEPKRTHLDVDEQPAFGIDRRDLAQQSGSAPADAPPPPPIDETPTATEEDLREAADAADSDVVTLREAVPEATEKVLPEARAVEDPPLPEKVRPTEAPAGDVTIRREGANLIEEYRREGTLYMVVVTPENGVRYSYLDTDGDGRLEGDPSEGRARPVYYTLYEWE